MPWTYVISDIKGKKIVGTFYKKEWQKTKQKEFRIEKVIKKENKLHVKWKGYDNSFNSWFDIKDSINEWILSKIKIFRSKYESWIRFARTADLKNAAGVKTSDFAKETDLANLKSDVDKLDIEKCSK